MTFIAQILDISLRASRMQESRNGSRLEITPKHVAFAEFIFGAILVLYWIYGNVPFVGLGLIIAIGGLAFIALLLYLTVATIVGPRRKWTYESKGVYWIVCILLFSSLFFYETLGDLVISATAGLCGVLLLLLSAWRFNIPRSEE